MRKFSIKLLKVFGIEIDIDLSWIIIFVLIAWSLYSSYFPVLLFKYSKLALFSLSIISALLFFISVLIHELVHSIISNKLGLLVNRITLFLFGGVAEIMDEPKDAKTEFLIAFAGPFTSLVLAFLFFLISRIFLGSELLYNGFHILYQMNLILAIFNMLPGFPLDGGRVLRSIIWWITKSYELATKFATISGKIIASFLILTGIAEFLIIGTFGGIWLFLIGFFLFTISGQEGKEMKIKNELAQGKVSDLITTNILKSQEFDKVSDIKNSLIQNHTPIALIYTDGKLSGVIDERTVVEQSFEDKKASDVMEPIEKIIKIQNSSNLLEAFKKIVINKKDYALVEQNNEIKGVLTMDVIVWYLKQKRAI